MPRTAVSMRSRLGTTARSSWAPALVSSTARVCRRNSATPTSSSRPWICRLMADWVSAKFVGRGTEVQVSRHRLEGAQVAGGDGAGAQMGLVLLHGD